MKNFCNLESDPPFCTSICHEAIKNLDFRVAIWTGHTLQMTLMCIPVYSDIGLEIHEDTDQIIRVEQGKAYFYTGKSKINPDYDCCLEAGDAVFIPAGTWHNVTNAGCTPLKISSFYAPPNHPRNTRQETKEDDHTH